MTQAATRYVAFMRALNVGGRTIKMDQLRALFEEIGLAEVETFIASGNVIFRSPLDVAALETQISEHLHTRLGYQAEAFLRTTAELAQIANTEPFPSEEFSQNSATMHIAFLQSPLPPTGQATVASLRSPKDDFHLTSRDLYWLIRGKMMESMVKGGDLTKALGVPTTVRNSNTIRRLVAKYPVD